MNNLYCYKMTHDLNHAPCINDGLLTIAICKKRIRRYCKIGDWLAGFSSKTLKDLQGNFVGTGKIVFIARVDEKITFREYVSRKQYAERYDYKFIVKEFAVQNCEQCNAAPEYDIDKDNVILSTHFYHVPEDKYLPVPAHLQYLIPQCRDYRLFSNKDADILLQFMDTIQ